MILGDMASIFAYSGKMTRTQAGGSYTFKVSGSFGFGLVVPTLFRPKPDSETILPKYITLYMALQAKELQGSWQKI